MTPVNDNTPPLAPCVHSGERVITRSGTVRVVALVAPDGRVWAFGPSGPEVVEVASDAWGGEHDLGLGLAA